MRIMKEIKELLDRVEEVLLDGQDLLITTTQEDKWEFKYELPKLRRLLLWVLEVKKQDKKKEIINNKKLTDFGIEEDEE